jgi:hypothetical protein
MKRLSSVVAFALLSGAALGCSGGGASGPIGFAEEALTTMPTKSGALSVAVRTAPEQPPVQGIDSVQYVFTDKDGAPVDGLTLAVQPWMPTMGHGSSIVPTVTASGDGTYVVTDVELFMPGEWVLRTTIGGAESDSVTPAFEIE